MGGTPIFGRQVGIVGECPEGPLGQPKLVRGP